MRPTIDLFLSACFIDVCLVLQSDGKFGNAKQAPKHLVVYGSLQVSFRRGVSFISVFKTALLHG